MSTTSRKLLRYWTQSHTTRTRDRSTGNLGERVDHRAERGGHIHGFAAAELAGRAEINQHGQFPHSLPCRWLPLSLATERSGRGPTPARSRILRDAPLVAEGHHVRARDPGDLGEPLDDLDADLHALIGDPVAGTPRSRRTMASGTWMPGTLVLMYSRRAQRPHRAHARDDPTRTVDAQIADIGHEPLEDVEVEDELGLCELGSGRNLLGQPAGPEADRGGERVLHRADQPVRRGSTRRPDSSRPWSRIVLAVHTS